MVLVAHIIVDVPLMQTDRPYSYLVPEAMQEQIAIGMRVHVPFGKGNRLLQGFIISQCLIRNSWIWLIRCDIRSFLIRFPS